MDSSIDRIVLDEKRTVLLKKEGKKEKAKRAIKHRFKNSLQYYVDSAVDGTRRYSYGDTFAHFSTKILRQFKRDMFNYLETHHQQQ